MADALGTELSQTVAFVGGYSPKMDTGHKIRKIAAFCLFGWVVDASTLIFAANLLKNIRNAALYICLRQISGWA